MLAHEHFEGPHGRDKPGLTSCLVCLVYLVEAV